MIGTHKQALWTDVCSMEIVWCQMVLWWISFNSGPPTALMHLRTSLLQPSIPLSAAFHHTHAARHWVTAVLYALTKKLHEIFRNFGLCHKTGYASLYGFVDLLIHVWSHFLLSRR